MDMSWLRTGQNLFSQPISKTQGLILESTSRIEHIGVFEIDNDTLLKFQDQ